MTNVVNINDVLDGHVVLDLACVDRLYLNAYVANMQVGQTSASGVSAVVASQPIGVSLLGQNWLSRLGSVTIEGDRMTLR